jgi:hypothetical protein
MRFSMNDRLKFLAIGACLFLLAGCATSTPKTPGVEDRAAARWDILLAGDLGGAYEYLSPGFRSSVSSLQYQRSVLLKRVRWTSAKVRSSECTESTCDVSVLLGYRITGVLPGVKTFDGTQDIVETWILADRMWYLVP